MEKKELYATHHGRWSYRGGKMPAAINVAPLRNATRSRMGSPAEEILNPPAGVAGIP